MDFESILFSMGVSSSRSMRLHEVRDALAAEQAHEVVLQREIEARLARVALTAGTAAELIVDAAGVVALGADDEQTAAGLRTSVGLARDLGLVLGERFGEQRAASRIS